MRIKLTRYCQSNWVRVDALTDVGVFHSYYEVEKTV